MAEEHLDRRALEGFGRGQLSRLENRSIVRHLLVGCQSCIRLASWLLPVAGLGRLTEDDLEGSLPLDLTCGPADAAELSPDRLEHSALFDYTPAFTAARRELAKRRAALVAEQA